MVLGFKQYFPWNGEYGKPEPTYFREKIITVAMMQRTPNGGLLPEETPSMPNIPIPFIPKIHTFREDSHNRWKAGMKVSMVYRGAGYKIIDHFNKDIPELDTIKSIQKIEIKYGKDLGVFKAVIVAVDGRILDEYERVKLAQNDGFKDSDQLFKWFKTDWSGKILHFTDFRYE